MLRLIQFWLLVSMTVASVATAAGPTTQPGSAPDDWPAFHRGGPLLGAGGPTPAPPLETRWTYRIEKAGIENGPAIVGQSVYVADDQGSLHCIDLANGQRRWIYKTENQAGFTTAPLVANGRVFIGDTDGQFYAISADTGKLLWKFDAGSTINSSANLTADGHVVFATDGGKVFCLAPDSNKPLWAATVERTNGAVAVAGGVGWLASCDKNLRSIDLKTGDVLQTIELSSETGAAPTVTDHGVVVGDNSGKVSCIDPITGKTRWTFDKIEEGTFVYSTAACSDGVVVVGARDSNVYGIDAETGRQRWAFATQGDVDSSPAISAGRVYVGSKDGKLYVLDLNRGKLLGQFEAAKAITSSPAISQGVVVFGDAGGNVYCLGAKK